MPNDTLKIKVENGWVTLEGELNWNYQREAAKNAVKNLEGVKGFSSKIIIKSDKTDKVEKEAIENALARNWSINDNDLQVNVNANEVTLAGMVDSYYQKDEAERIAWKAPGVSAVNNELSVGYLD